MAEEPSQKGFAAFDDLVSDVTNEIREENKTASSDHQLTGGPQARARVLTPGPSCDAPGPGSPEKTSSDNTTLGSNPKPSKQQVASERPNSLDAVKGPLNNGPNLFHKPLSQHEADGLAQFARHLEDLIQRSDSHFRVKREADAIAALLAAKQLALQTALMTTEACEVSFRLLSRLQRCGHTDDALALVEHLLPFARDGRMRNVRVKALESVQQEILTRRGSTESPKRPLYACQRCGSLLCWLSDFCPSCGFIPIDFDSVLRGLALSTNLFPSVEILVIGRQIRNGTGVPRLDEGVEAMKTNAAFREAGAGIIQMTWDRAGIMQMAPPQEEPKKPRLLELFKCPSCGQALTDTGIKSNCTRCGAAHGFPELKKALFFVRYLLWSMEYDLAIPQALAYGELAAALVGMRDRILINHQMPTDSERAELLDLLAAFDNVPLEDRSIVVMRDHRDGKVYYSTAPGVTPTSDRRALAEAAGQALIGVDRYMRQGIAL
jgi:rubrerythrin